MSSSALHANAAVNKPASKPPAAPPAAAPATRKVRFNVGTDYSVLDVIGEGAYGVVVSAIHRPSGSKVGIKKVSDAIASARSCAAGILTRATHPDHAL